MIIYPSFFFFDFFFFDYCNISATGFNTGVKATVESNSALDRENIDTEEEHQMVNTRTFKKNELY